MVWESYQSSRESSENNKNYTKHYIYEPNSFVPLFQTGYAGFIKLIETPNYSRFQHEPYSIYKDPVWSTETRKNKAELERVAFYHCDQVGTPQTLSNELGECIWEIKQDTWGTALEINASDNLLEQTNLRFQGQYYDHETGLHYNRYRYYEPFSAKYVSKDPIGLHGGLNNSAYVSDPNQWVDPMGLQQNDDRGLFWLSDSAQKSNNETIEKTKQVKQNTKTNLEFLESDAAKGRVVRANTPVINKESTSQRNDFPIINNQIRLGSLNGNQSNTGGGVLSAVLPTTMSGFAKSPQLAQDLKQQGAIRNTNLSAVAVAGYAPYVLAPAAEAGIAGTTVAGRTVAPIAKKAVAPIVQKISPYLGTGATLEGAGLTVGTVGKVAGVSAAIGGGMDVGFQALKCKCINDINLYQTAGVAATSAVVSGWGATTSAAAGFGQVGWGNIILNSPKLGTFVKNNSSGLFIWANEQVLGQAGSRAVKSATTDKEESHKK